MDWELYDWWFEYLAEAVKVVMTKGGVKEKAIKSHFARIRAKSRGRPMSWDDEGRREKKEKSRFFATVAFEIQEIDEVDEEANVPLDTTPRGGLVWEDPGFNAPVAKPKTPPATPVSKTETDWRLRGCAPMTSKSSPFARIPSF